VDQPVLGVATLAQVDAELDVAEADRLQNLGPGRPVPLRREDVVEGAQGRALLAHGDELIGALQGVLGLGEAGPAAEEAGHGRKKVWFEEERRAIDRERSDGWRKKQKLALVLFLYGALASLTRPVSRRRERERESRSSGLVKDRTEAVLVLVSSHEKRREEKK